VQGFGTTLYDAVLWLHITAMVVAFGALFAYPVFLAVVATAPIAQRAAFHHAQIAFSQRVTGPTIGVILLAGATLRPTPSCGRRSGSPSRSCSCS
jgi:hypothetical protein